MTKFRGRFPPTRRAQERAQALCRDDLRPRPNRRRGGRRGCGRARRHRANRARAGCGLGCEGAAVVSARVLGGPTRPRPRRAPTPTLGNYVSSVRLGGGGGSPAEPVSDGLRSLVTGRNTGRGDKTGLSCRPMRQENRGFSEAFQPDSLLDLTGSRTEENREAISDYRERLLKRRPFRVRVRSAPPAAPRCVQFNRSLAYYYNAAVQ